MARRGGEERRASRAAQPRVARRVGVGSGSGSSPPALTLPLHDGAGGRVDAGGGVGAEPAIHEAAGDVGARPLLQEVAVEAGPEAAGLQGSRVKKSAHASASTTAQGPDAY